MSDRKEPSYNSKEATDFALRQRKNNPTYRIQKANGTYLNAGTDSPSWFNLEDARRIVNYDEGQRIVEHNGVDILWEIF